MPEVACSGPDCSRSVQVGPAWAARGLPAYCRKACVRAAVEQKRGREVGVRA